MSIDAREQQLTMDKNYTHIPAIRVPISFYKTGGELIEACRNFGIFRPSQTSSEAFTPSFID